MGPSGATDIRPTLVQVPLPWEGVARDPAVGLMLGQSVTASCSLQASRVSTFRKGDRGLRKNFQPRGGFREQHVLLIVSLELERRLQQPQGAA